jgi:hypothetical protein
MLLNIFTLQELKNVEIRSKTRILEVVVFIVFILDIHQKSSIFSLKRK